MKIAVLATDAQWEEITSNKNTGVYERMASVNWVEDANAYLVLKEDTSFGLAGHTVPVFVNAVATTLKKMQAGRQVIRINGWPGFLKRSHWEMAGEIDDITRLVCSEMKKEVISVPDVPGLVTARVIAMIVNEAYYTLQENISTKEEIDTAMKLGTNYPYGPFEWAAKIGEHRLAQLLEILSEKDASYTPAPLLKTVNIS